MPPLTVVTIVRNHSDGLLKTINSLQSQIFSGYEYIVVDGASTDGTLDVIKQYESIFAKILYGPDKGIYDAMNKGIDAAEGEYIIFMNAGDVFAHDNSISDVFDSMNGSPDVLYGDYSIDYGFMTRNAKGFDVKELWKGMITSHQAVFVKTSLAKNLKFDLSFRLGADFDMIYRIYKNGGTFSYFPVEIAVTEAGGLSDVKRLTVYQNHMDTVKAHGITIYQRLYYYYMMLDAWTRLTLKKILPMRLVKKIIAMKADR